MKPFLGAHYTIKPGGSLNFPEYRAMGTELGEVLDAIKTGVVTVVFGFQPKTAIDATSDLSGLSVKAHFTSSGMDRQEIEFDLLNGVAISVPAWIFGATVNYTNPSGFNGTNPDLEVSMTVGKGSSPRGISGNLRKTVDLGSIASGGESDPILIPAFADQLVIQTVDNTTTSLLVNQRAGLGGPVVSAMDVGKRENEAAPLAHGASSITVVNTTAAAISAKVGFRLVFGA